MTQIRTITAQGVEHRPIFFALGNVPQVDIQFSAITFSGASKPSAVTFIVHRRVGSVVDPIESISFKAKDCTSPRAVRVPYEGDAISVTVAAFDGGADVTVSTTVSVVPINVDPNRDAVVRDLDSGDNSHAIPAPGSAAVRSFAQDEPIGLFAATLTAAGQSTDASVDPASKLGVLVAGLALSAFTTIVAFFTRTRVVVATGNPTTDTAALNAAFAASAGVGRVILAGTFVVNARLTIPNTGPVLVGTFGSVKIVSVISNGDTLIAGDGYTGKVLKTTLSAPATLGSADIVVVSAAALAVGNPIIVQAVDTTLVASYFIKAISGTTVTLDRAVRKPFAAAAEVHLSPGFPTLRIIGDGLAIYGTGGIGIEILAGRNCHVEGVEIRSAFSLWAASFDFAGTNCHWHRCKVYFTPPVAWVASTVYPVGAVVSAGGNAYVATVGGTAAGSGGPSGTGAGAITDGGVTWYYAGTATALGGQWGLGLEENENSSISECYAQGSFTSSAFLFNSCEGCWIDKSSAFSGVRGLAFESGVANPGPGGDSRGNRNCAAFACNFGWHSAAGIYVVDGASDIDLVGCSAWSSVNNLLITLTGGGVVTYPSRVRVWGGSYTRGSNAGVRVDGGSSHRMYGIDVSGSSNGLFLTGTASTDDFGTFDVTANDCTSIGVALVGANVTKAHLSGTTVYRSGQSNVSISCTDATFDGLTAFDVGSAQSAVYIGGASRVVIRNARYGLTAPVAVYYGIRSEAAADVTIRDSECTLPGASGTLIGVFINAAAAVTRVSNFLLRDGGGGPGAARYGIWNNAAANVEIGTGVDVSIATTPVNLAGGGMSSRGSVTANGAGTAQDLSYTATKSTSGLTLRMRTKGGTPAGASYVVTAGTKIAVTFAAADTSVYDYEITPTK